MEIYIQFFFLMGRISHKANAPTWVCVWKVLVLGQLRFEEATHGSFLTPE